MGIRHYALMAIILFMPNLAATAQPSEAALSAACHKRGAYLGPYRFEKWRDIPLNLQIESCLDGTAWTNLFNFDLRFAAKLGELQGAVDALINNATNTCIGQENQILVNSLKIASEPEVKFQQRVILSFVALATRCSFPKLSANMSVSVPLTLNTKTLRIIYDVPVVTVSRDSIIGWAATFIPALRDYVKNSTIDKIKPHLDQYKNLLADNKDKIQLFKPVVKKLTIQTNNNILAANLRLDARVPKQYFEEQSIVLFKFLELK